MTGWIFEETEREEKKLRNDPTQKNQTLLNTLFQESTMISIRAKRAAWKSTKTDGWTKNNSRSRQRRQEKDRNR